MDLFEMAQDVDSREALARFLHEAVADLSDNESAWENVTLADFLEAWGAWLQAMPQGCANRGEPVPDSPSWNLVAQMVMAGRIYE
ncbi:hypothetical protein AB0N81_10905 [Streptomyces sp. NPDC093510]|uniref:DUF7660 family protein n=1 Tax=Streptomyces sp. NPDC093510 TaxID=3155199 RepID=UPI0034168439